MRLRLLDVGNVPKYHFYNMCYVNNIIKLFNNSGHLHNMFLNTFLSKESLNGIDATIYSIVGLDEFQTSNPRYSTAWRLSRAVKDHPAVPYHDAHEIFMIGQGPPEIIYQDQKAILLDQISVDTSKPDHRQALASLLSEHLKAGMRGKGYATNETGRFFPKRPKIERLENGEPLQLFRDGCLYQVEVLENGHVLVWIDPKSRIKQTALDFISWKSQGSSKHDIEKYLIGQKVNLDPFGMSGMIESIDWIQSPVTYTFPAPVNIQNRTGVPEVNLQDYWKFSHRVQINADDAPLIMVKLKGKQGSVPYPPSTVYLTTKGKQLPNRIRNTFIMPPWKRIQKTEQLAKVILDGHHSIGDHQVSFTVKMANDHILRSNGKIVSVGSVVKPTFLMGGTRKAKDPKKIRNLGPFSNARHIPIYYLMPENVRLNVDQFHDQLQRAMNTLKLGTLQHIGLHRVQYSGVRPTRNDYWDAALEVSHQLNKMESVKSPNGLTSGKPIILSVLPGKDSNAYAGGKQAAHEEEQVIQNITLQSARKIANDDMYTGMNTAIQLYLKSLKRGMAPWILEQPAGGAHGTAYLGYDVSRRFEAEGGVRKEAAATISMVDGLGRHILNKTHTTQSGEKLDENTANWIVFNVSRSAKKTFETYGRPFKRLVIYKDGIVRKNEVATIRRGVHSAIENMLPKSSMPDTISVELISVVKSSIERLYTDTGENVDDGAFVVFSDGNAVVVNSHLAGKKADYVTAQPTRLEPKFRISEEGEMTIQQDQIGQLVHEFCDLCYLDWASIFHQPKYPIVLQLVQKLGEQYTLDISDPTYLPL